MGPGKVRSYISIDHETPILIGLLNVGWAAFASVSDQLPGLSERTLTLINLIWLAIAGFQITAWLLDIPPRVNELKQKIKEEKETKLSSFTRHSILT